ncbi:MAG: Gldg family protein [Bacteriovoracaceae bacterium]
MVRRSVVFNLWIFIAASLWIVNIVMYTVAPEFLLFNRGLLGTTLGLSALFVFVFRRRLLRFIKKPYTGKLLSCAFAVFLLIGIIGMLNYLAVKTSKKFDLTTSRLHTLSDQSKKIAREVKEELKITLFAQREEWEKYLPLLRQYRDINSNIKLKAVDIEAEPTLTRTHNIEKSGTVMLEIGEKKLKAPAKNELEVTNLLIKALRSKSLTLYYTTGHDELGRTSEEARGASFLFNVLDNGNYQLKPLDTLKVNQVPADADALLALGPQKGFMDIETEIIADYMERGGNLFVLLGPNFKNADFGNLNNLLAKRGVIRHNALTLDRLSAVQGANATIPIVNRYNHEHSITKNFSGRTLFPLSAALRENEIDHIQYTALAMSSPFPASWAEAELEGINSGKVYYNKGIDMKGPVDLLVVAEDSKNYAKLAVSASSEFVSNAYQNQSSNFNLFMNVLAWLVDDEGIISLNRPKLDNNMIMLSASQVSLIFYFSILFLPFTFFGFAIWVYRKRLNK